MGAKCFGRGGLKEAGKLSRENRTHFHAGSVSVSSPGRDMSIDFVLPVHNLMARAFTRPCKERGTSMVFEQVGHAVACAHRFKGGGSNGSAPQTTPGMPPTNSMKERRVKKHFPVGSRFFRGHPQAHLLGGCPTGVFFRLPPQSQPRDSSYFSDLPWTPPITVNGCGHIVSNRQVSRSLPSTAGADSCCSVPEIGIRNSDSSSLCLTGRSTKER